MKTNIRFENKNTFKTRVLCFIPNFGLKNNIMLGTTNKGTSLVILLKPSSLSSE
jgi:hypothetical protein